MVFVCRVFALLATQQKSNDCKFHHRERGVWNTAVIFPLSGVENVSFVLGVAVFRS